VSKQVWALVELQLLTGARAGELVGLRPMDLDMTGKVWAANLGEHKTAHWGYERTLYLGPHARKVIKPFLSRPTDRPMFSPAEAERDRRDQAHEKRITPLKYGNAPGTNKSARPKRPPGETYDVGSYRRAIQRACTLAKVPSWHPHALRHNAATNLRREFGIEVARVVLGHRSPAMTAVYAELDAGKAVEAIGKVG
jgi:integrase